MPWSFCFEACSEWLEAFFFGRGLALLDGDRFTCVGGSGRLPGGRGKISG